MRATLSMPESSLAEVIVVIRAGLIVADATVSAETKTWLTEWCDEQEEYLQ